MNRRAFLGGSAMVGLSGCAYKTRTSGLTPTAVPIGAIPTLMPVPAELDRIF
jgi:hypothetical protein